MEIKEIKNKEVWEGFLSKAEEKTFLQSWNWGEFNKTMGDKIWRLGIFENDNLVSVSLVIKIVAKRGNFLFLPHGPIFNKTLMDKATIKRQILMALLEELKKIAREEKVNFIRIAPVWERSKEKREIFKKLGFRKAPIHIHPELTWELDIRPSEEELLMAMRKTTRYLIRKGSRRNKDIKIVKSQKIEDIEIFNKLYQATVNRQNFVPFSLDYLKNEFLAFNPDNQILILLGKYKGEIISSGIFIFWQNLAFYHQGATLLKYPKVPASYLLQWEAIREAKKRGCQRFNFWGIAPEGEKNHPWAGLTLFKKGFGGNEKEYLETQDFPLSKSYYLTFLFEKLRRIKRGL